MAERERHPPQLKILFFTEMWERFSFYLMLAILPLYLEDSEKGGLGWTGTQAAQLVGTYMALVYFTPFIGGLLADRILGYRRSVIIGGILMMIGHLVLAVPNSYGLYGGITFLILGNGLFKPNISTMVGGLYPPGSKLRDGGYSIFYMGVNLGAFICNFVTAIVRNYFDDHPIQITEHWKLEGWHAAFSVAAFGMLLGLILFSVCYKMFAHVDQRIVSTDKNSKLSPLFYECLIPATVFAVIFYYLGQGDTGRGLVPFKQVTSAFIGSCIPVAYFYISIWLKLTDVLERRRTGALLALYLIVIIFWSVFHLNTTALTVFARDNTDRIPNGPVSILTDNIKDYAEDADSKYYINADPSTPRPAKDTFVVISEEEYKKKEKAKELSVKEDKPLYVTQKRFDEVYKRATSETPLLAKGKHLQVVNTELFQSINPAYVILFTPLVVGFFHLLRARGWEPSTPAKIGLGLLLTGFAPLVMLAATYAANDGAIKVTSYWLFGTYAIATFGELCLSPIGLSFVNKMAPAQIRAFMMGGWSLSAAIGNKLSGVFGEIYSVPDTNRYIFWVLLSIGTGIAASAVFILLPWFKRSLPND